MKRPRWAVFISGRGSNLASLLTQRGELDVRVVVSSSVRAFGNVRAHRAGVPVWQLKSPIQREDWKELSQRLLEHHVDCIFLAGFMKVLPKTFIEFWDGRILNIHPSLLPAFPGLDSIRRSYEAQADMGVSIHVVTREVDKGPIIFQTKVIESSRVGLYTLEQCEFLLHVHEHRLIREAATRWQPINP